MALEIKEPSGATEGANRRDKRSTFACAVEGTCCTSLNCQIRLLGSNGMSGLLRIRIFVDLFTDIEEFGLARRACVLAPKPLEVDEANIAAS